jgi:hypothetical protein
MLAAQTAVPKWILIVSGIFALMEIGVSLSMIFSPQSVLESVDHTAKGVNYLVYMWATRQFALGIILAYAIYKRSAPMLTLAWLFLLVMFLGDLVTGIAQKENTLVITAVIMCLLSAGMLYAINKRTRKTLH